MSDDTKMTGGCMCGAVRYETTGESFGVNHCHCQSCRKHNGAAVVTLAGFKADQVTFSGDKRKIYESSPGVGRAFCGKCGTPLTWEGDGDDDWGRSSNSTSALSTNRTPWCRPPMPSIPSASPGSTLRTTCRVMRASPTTTRRYAMARPKRACHRPEFARHSLWPTGRWPWDLFDSNTGSLAPLTAIPKAIA